VKINVTSTGKTTIDADATWQEPQIRAALRQLANEDAADDYVASEIIELTDSERSDISHDEYATVTEDDGTVLWAGWLDGRDEPAPEPAADVVELTDTHVQLLTEILLNADGDFKSAEEAPEYVAEAYVRWLESERARLLAELGQPS
jgi:hypothetical protein